MTTANIHSQKILILDFGSQYTQLIARRVRELGVYCEIWDYAVDEQLFREFDPQGVIFSGSPESANHDESPRPPEFIYALANRFLASAMACKLWQSTSRVKSKPRVSLNLVSRRSM